MNASPALAAPTAISPSSVTPGVGQPPPSKVARANPAAGTEMHRAASLPSDPAAVARLNGHSDGPRSSDPGGENAADGERRSLGVPRTEEVSMDLEGHRAEGHPSSSRRPRSPRLRAVSSVDSSVSKDDSEGNLSGSLSPPPSPPLSPGSLQRRPINRSSRQLEDDAATKRVPGSPDVRDTGRKATSLKLNKPRSPRSGGHRTMRKTTSVLPSQTAGDAKIEPADEDTSPDGRFVRYSGESERLLGEGAYKKVWLACDTLEGREVAWNNINIGNLPKREKSRIVSEIKLLKSLGKNDHIIEFVSTWSKRETREVIFITEIMPSGSLKDFINRVRVIKYKVIKKWCQNILNGLIFLHTHDPPIIHRDLKCDNLFYDGSHRRGGKIVIGDMGLSTYMLGPKPGSVLGTPQFMAPELYEDQGYDERIDIYSFGMCVLEMVSKKPPYDGLNVAQIYKRVTAGEMPPLLSKVKNEVCKAFISVCLAPPALRPTAAELLQHEFLVTQHTISQRIMEDSVDSDVPRVVLVPDDEMAELVDDEDVYTGIRQSKAAPAGIAGPSWGTEDPEQDMHDIPEDENMISNIDGAGAENDLESVDSDDDVRQEEAAGLTRVEPPSRIWDDSEEKQLPKAETLDSLEGYENGSVPIEVRSSGDGSSDGQSDSMDIAEQRRPPPASLRAFTAEPENGLGEPLRSRHPQEASIVIMPGETDDLNVKTVEIDVPEAGIQLEFPMDLNTDTVEQIADEMLQAFAEMNLEVHHTKDGIVALLQESLDRQAELETPS